MNFQSALQFQARVNKRRHIENFLADAKDRAVLDAMARGELPTGQMPPGMQEALSAAFGGLKVVMHNATGTPEGDAMIAEAEMTAKKNTKVH